VGRHWHCGPLLVRRGVEMADDVTKSRVWQVGGWVAGLALSLGVWGTRGAES